MGTDDHVILNSRAAHNGGTPSNENVVANGNRLLVTQNLPSLALYNRPTVIMSQDGDGPGKINVISDGQKVWIGHVDMRFSRTMERNVLPDSDPARAQVFQVTLVIHKKFVVNLPRNIFQSHSCSSNLEKTERRSHIENVRGSPLQQLHKGPLRKTKSLARIFVYHPQQPLIACHLPYGIASVVSALAAHAGYFLRDTHLHIDEQRLRQSQNAIRLCGRVRHELEGVVIEVQARLEAVRPIRGGEGRKISAVRIAHAARRRHLAASSQKHELENEVLANHLTFRGEAKVVLVYVRLCEHR